MVLLNSPRLTQCTRFEILSSSGDASSLSAITAMSIPWLRAPSSTRNGKRPFPAISPQPVELVLASGMKSASQELLHDAALGALDEFDQFLHVGEIAEGFSHFGNCLRGIQLCAQQQSKSALQYLQPLGRKAFALQAYRIDAETFRLAFSDDFRKRRHVLRNHRRSPDVGVAADAAKLVHRAKRANGHEIFHRDVPGERRAVHKQRVAADYTFMPHLRVRHKEVSFA